MVERRRRWVRYLVGLVVLSVFLALALVEAFPS
jgi:hypothetical protein